MTQSQWNDSTPWQSDDWWAYGDESSSWVYSSDWKSSRIREPSCGSSTRCSSRGPMHDFCDSQSEYGGMDNGRSISEPSSSDSIFAYPTVHFSPEALHRASDQEENPSSNVSQHTKKDMVRGQFILEQDIDPGFLSLN